MQNTFDNQKLANYYEFAFIRTIAQEREKKISSLFSGWGFEFKNKIIKWNNLIIPCTTASKCVR